MSPNFVFDWFSDINCLLKHLKYYLYERIMKETKNFFFKYKDFFFPNLLFYK